MNMMHKRLNSKNINFYGGIGDLGSSIEDFAAMEHVFTSNIVGVSQHRTEIHRPTHASDALSPLMSGGYKIGECIHGREADRGCRGWINGTDRLVIRVHDMAPRYLAGSQYPFGRACRW